MLIVYVKYIVGNQKGKWTLNQGSIVWNGISVLIASLDNAAASIASRKTRNLNYNLKVNHFKPRKKIVPKPRLSISLHAQNLVGDNLLKNFVIIMIMKDEKICTYISYVWDMRFFKVTNTTVINFNDKNGRNMQPFTYCLACMIAMELKWMNSHFHFVHNFIREKIIYEKWSA